jgi:hypothetical protein
MVSPKSSHGEKVRPVKNQSAPCAKLLSKEIDSSLPGIGIRPAPHGKRQRSTGFNRSRSWLFYSAFAEAFLAFRRIDFAARLRWVLDLL